jgi:superfamily II DNA or RNA helicase
MIGRVIRASSETGKKDAIVLDHSGATYRHGRVEDPIEWTLDEDHKLKNKTQEERASNHSERKLVACPKCEALRTGGEACPHCGYLTEITDTEVGRQLLENRAGSRRLLARK